MGAHKIFHAATDKAFSHILVGCLKIPHSNKYWATEIYDNECKFQHGYLRYRCYRPTNPGTRHIDYK